MIITYENNENETIEVPLREFFIELDAIKLILKENGEGVSIELENRSKGTPSLHLNALGEDKFGLW